MSRKHRTMGNYYQMLTYLFNFPADSMFRILSRRFPFDWTNNSLFHLKDKQRILVQSNPKVRKKKITEILVFHKKNSYIIERLH